METKNCYKCKTVKSKEDFYKIKRRYDGLCEICKDCERKRKLEQRSRNIDSHRARNKRYYENNKEKFLSRRKLWGEKNKLKIKAHTAVKNALLKGNLKRLFRCEICKRTPTDAHHADYSRPLEIKWLCRSCHMKVHQSR